jgi:C4-dicarboxylate transporter, DctM subunit
LPEWALSLFAGMALVFAFGAIGVPIAFSLVIASFLCISFFLNPMVALSGLRVVLYGAVTEAALLPVPLFVLMASIFLASGVSAGVYDSFAKLFGGFRAGLLVATNGMLAFFGALMGSSSAAITMVTQMGAAELKSRGYSNIAIGGVIAGGSGLAVVIPPSILMILYSVVMEVSVIKLFAAGLIPGLLLAIGNTIWIILYTHFHPPRQIEAPQATAANQGPASRAGTDTFVISKEAALALQGQISAMGRLRAAAALLPLLGVIVVMLGSMFLGYASVTEGAAVGVFGALLVGWRRLTPRNLGWALWNTAKITCFIMMLILGGRYFGMYFSLTGISTEFISWIQALPFDGIVLLLVIMLVFMLIGCVMETITMMLVLVPIAVTALIAIGYDPIVLGVLFVINLEMSLVTPPIGSNLFVLAGMGRPHGITLEQIIRGTIPYLFISAIVIILIAEFPILATFLSDMVR